MSFLAIGAVTKAIAELVEKKLNKPPLMGEDAKFRVTTLPPDDERVEDADGVNLFLYRVTESPFFKNRDWRGDRANPVGVKRPPLSLTLHYLLTAYTKKSNGAAQDDITAHQILGNAMAILHEHPVLNDVHDSDFDAEVETQFAPELRQAFEKIKMTMAPIAMEEFSKIWTGLSKAYRLSVAYEVSLAQIAPIAPAPLPAPPVQKTGLQIITLDPPVISAITPAVGPAGALITLRGSGFKAKGFPTLVQVGEPILTETDLVKLAEDEIVLNIPEAPQAGPQLRLVVSARGRESAPAFYEVRPWLETIQPLRGLSGIPLTLPFDFRSGTNPRVEIDGREATVTFDPENQSIRATVPESIANNGPKPVVLILDGPTPQRSNARFFDVLPAIHQADVVTTTDPVTTTVTINGQRLLGDEVHVKRGSLVIKKGKNAEPNRIVVEVPRLVPANLPVSVVVDGRESNTIPPMLERFEPQQVAAGQTLTLIGKGFSGRQVEVRFGEISTIIGAHAFASQITVQAPTTLTPGTVAVQINVDGNVSAPAPLSVIA